MKGGGLYAVYASLNGTTVVITRQVPAGPSPGLLKPICSPSANGFETIIAVRTTEPYVAVQTKHRSGWMLGTSKAVKPRN